MFSSVLSYLNYRSSIDFGYSFFSPVSIVTQKEPSVLIQYRAYLAMYQHQRNSLISMIEDTNKRLQRLENYLSALTDKYLAPPFITETKLAIDNYIAQSTLLDNDIEQLSSAASLMPLERIESAAFLVGFEFRFAHYELNFSLHSLARFSGVLERYLSGDQTGESMLPNHVIHLVVNYIYLCDMKDDRSELANLRRKLLDANLSLNTFELRYESRKIIPALIKIGREELAMHCRELANYQSALADTDDRLTKLNLKLNEIDSTAALQVEEAGYHLMDDSNHDVSNR